MKHETQNKLYFGQVVIGPPGSGKTTFCRAMKRHLLSIERKAALINLDPANFVDNFKFFNSDTSTNSSSQIQTQTQSETETEIFEFDIDINDLITIQDVMQRFELGPNGAMIYAIDFLSKNLNQLREEIEKKFSEDTYLLFDCPGQIELYTNHNSMKNIVGLWRDKWEQRLTAVNLIDSHNCLDPYKYISALLVSLSTMLHLELPHINILSKIDLFEQQKNLFEVNEHQSNELLDLKYYTNPQDFSQLVHKRKQGNDKFSKRYEKLTEALCELIEDFSLVRFSTLNVEDRKSLQDLLKKIDKSNGYIYGDKITEAYYDQMMKFS